MLRDEGDSSHRVIVARNCVINLSRIAVRINDCNNRDTKSLGFCDCNLLFFNIDNEQNLRQLFHFLDATEEFVQTLNFCCEHERLALRLSDHCVFCKCIFQEYKSLDSRLDRLEVGHHSTEPALVDVHRTGSLGVLLDRTLGLGLSPDQQALTAPGNNLLDERLSGFQRLDCFG